MLQSHEGVYNYIVRVQFIISGYYHFPCHVFRKLHSLVYITAESKIPSEGQNRVPKWWMGRTLGRKKREHYFKHTF